MRRPAAWLQRRRREIAWRLSDRRAILMLDLALVLAELRLRADEVRWRWTERYAAFCQRLAVASSRAVMGRRLYDHLAAELRARSVIQHTAEQRARQIQRARRESDPTLN
jgi:hypothetical protein